MKINNDKYMSEDIGQFIGILKKSKCDNGKAFVVSTIKRLYRA